MKRYVHICDLCGERAETEEWSPPKDWCALQDFTKGGGTQRDICRLCVEKILKRGERP